LPLSAITLKRRLVTVVTADALQARAVVAVAADGLRTIVVATVSVCSIDATAATPRAAVTIAAVRTIARLRNVTVVATLVVATVVCSRSGVLVDAMVAPATAAAAPQITVAPADARAKLKLLPKYLMHPLKVPLRPTTVRRLSIDRLHTVVKRQLA